MLNATMLNILEDRLHHAAIEHPEGPTMKALKSEIREADVEFKNNKCFDYIYELYDVMTVAWRLIEQLEHKYDQH
jgi:hypothetical protein